jgi:hypothetical protein
VAIGNLSIFYNITTTVGTGSTTTTTVGTGSTTASTPSAGASTYMVHIILILFFLPMSLLNLY